MALNEMQYSQFKGKITTPAAGITIHEAMTVAIREAINIVLSSEERIVFNKRVQEMTEVALIIGASISDYMVDRTIIASNSHSHFSGQAYADSPIKASPAFESKLNLWDKIVWSAISDNEVDEVTAIATILALNIYVSEERRDNIKELAARTILTNWDTIAAKTSSGMYEYGGDITDVFE